MTINELKTHMDTFKQIEKDFYHGLDILGLEPSGTTFSVWDRIYDETLTLLAMNVCGDAYSETKKEFLLDYMMDGCLYYTDDNGEEQKMTDEECIYYFQTNEEQLEKRFHFGVA